MIPALTCPCKACVGMRRMYGKDPDLLEFYGKKLLVRGWVGPGKRHSRADGVEKAYIQAHASWARAATRNLRQ